MITHIRALVMILAAILLPQTLLAADLKIGIVQTAKILNEAPQVKYAKEHLQKEFAGRESKLASHRDELKKQEEHLQRNGSIMSDEQRRKLEHELITGKREFVRAQNEYREDLNIRQNEIFSKVQQQIQQVIHQLAREQKYDLILEDFVYSSDRIDLTSRVLERLQQQAARSNASSKTGN